MFAQFSTPAKTTIVAIFGCAQDPVAYPNQEEIDEADPRYIAYVAKIPTNVPPMSWE